MSGQEVTPVLTQDQVAGFHRDGFLALRRLVPEDEVAWLCVVYDRLFAERAGREFGDQFDLAGADEEGTEARLPQILNPARYAPELKEGEYRTSALTVARQLLGPEAQPQGEHAIFKPARVGAETPWHQDEAYWNPAMDYSAISIWIPLQEASVENGCLHFVPGSHRWDVLPHHCIGHDPRVHGLEVDAADTSSAVACPIPAGGATIHHNRTVHYAGPNVSDVPRRAYILAFGVPPKPAAQPRNYYWNAQKRTARQERANRGAAGSGS